MPYETVFDLITKSINPFINEISSTLTFGPSSTTYRVDTVTFRRRDRSYRIIDMFEMWREEVFRKYGQKRVEELSAEDIKDIVKSYYNLFLYLTRWFWSKEGLAKLWWFGKHLEKELNSDHQIFTEETLLELAFSNTKIPDNHPVEEKTKNIPIIAGISLVVGVVVGILIGFLI
ncbi:MAG: hypothetical protein H0Z19_05185 [Archaeoglobus sp.]|uniref:hypothetical protein n=1 Tax=Archaeoglobus sp. TaxID=1872626 RepID=UPI001DEF1F59|nr:hypothetical protein [Archaeoglobus sp.]MBO8179861.1 hypothetical protein [Archaeoglobus sp.]